MRHSNDSKGFVFLEVLMATSLISVAFVALLGIVFMSLNLSTSLQKTAQADFLAKEEMEAIRSYRDASTWATDGLGSLLVSTNYYASLNNSTPPKWVINTGSETTGIFTKSFTVERVYRYNSNNNIVESGCGGNPCTLDANTMKVTVTVAYEGKTYQLISYFTNWQNH